jgi:myosin heavy subunit
MVCLISLSLVLSLTHISINYCNEKLQFHFNNHIFLMEQQEYLKEGVSMIAIKVRHLIGVIPCLLTHPVLVRR